MKVWVSIVAMLFTSSCYSQVTKLDFVKGQKFEVATTLTLNSTTDIMGNIADRKTERVSVQVINIANVMNGVTDLEISTSKLKVSMESNGQVVEYDSDKKDNPVIMMESFGEELGRKRSIVVNSSGSLIKEHATVQNSVVNLDVLTGGLQGGGIPVFQTFFIGKTFSVNAVWHDSLVTETDKVKTTISGSYNIKTIENNIAVVLFQGVQKSTGLTEQMGQEFSTTSDFTVNAEIKADITTGMIIHCAVAFEGQMHIDISGLLALVKLTTTSESIVKAY